MFPIVPIAIFVGTFSVAAWVVNKALTAVTGKSIEENLDAGYDKVLAFVKPAETTDTETP